MPFHINESKIVLPCNKPDYCGYVHFEEAIDAWEWMANKRDGIPDDMNIKTLEDITQGKSERFLKVNEMLNRSSYYDLSVIPQEFWSELGPVTMEINEDTNSVTLTSNEINGKLTIEFKGDCCSNTKIMKDYSMSSYTNLDLPKTIKNISSEETESIEDEDTYQVTKSVKHQFNFTDGSSIPVIDENESNGYYSTYFDMAFEKIS